MDTETPTTETGVQPDGQPSPEGQGQAGQGGEGLGLYDLSAVPEELRPYVEEQAKVIEGNVTRKLQEHASEREQWEPLTQIEGLSDVPHEELTELMQFRELASDPEKFEEWWNGIGDELGLFEEDDEDGEFEGGEDGEEDPRIAALEQELASLREEVQPLREHQASTEQSQRVDAARAQIRTDLDALKPEHGETDPEKVERIEAAVVKFAHAYPDDPDAIKKAFADYQEITGQAQGELVDDKLDQPAPTMNGGAADTTAPKVSFNDPALKAAMKTRLTAGR